MKIRTLLIGAAFTLGALPAAQAQVYSCMVNGEVLYTSKPRGDCQRAELKPIGSYSSVKPIKRVTPSVSAKPRSSSSVAANRGVAIPPPTAGNTTAVHTGTRDSGRRNILEQELANERNALMQAKQALTSGRSMLAHEKNNYAQYQARIRQLESAVLDREQNVQALQRELGRM